MRYIEWTTKMAKYHIFWKKKNLFIFERIFIFSIKIVSNDLLIIILKVTINRIHVLFKGIWIKPSIISINYIKSSYAATVFIYCSYHFFHCLSKVEIWWGTLFFLTVATVSGCIVATVITVFFFFRLYLFFLLYINCYTDTTNFTIFLQLLRCQFLISQNKIIKYETMINHNWK